MQAPAKNRILTIILIITLLLTAAAGVMAEAPDASDKEGQPLSNELLGKLFPEVNDMPYPGWLKEGLRVYYRTSTGKLSRSASQGVQDLSDAPLLKPEDLSVMPFLLRTDVTSVYAKRVISYTTVFVDQVYLPWDDISDTWPYGMGSFWIHTGLLKPSGARQEIKTSDISWKILSEEYQAVRIDFDYTAQNGSHYVWIIEKSTGLLLYSARIYRPKPGAEVEITSVEFYSMRYLPVAWTSQTLPSFVRQGLTLSYEGNIQSWNPKTGPGLSVPAMMQVKLEAVEPRWIQARFSRVYSEKETYESQAYIGPAQLGGAFWLPVGYLAGLKEGQVIDKDSITGSVTEVSYIGRAKDGTSRIAIFEFGKNYKRAWIYRSTDGMLIYWMEDKLIDPIMQTSQKSEWNLK